MRACVCVRVCVCVCVCECGVCARRSDQSLQVALPFSVFDAFILASRCNGTPAKVPFLHTQTKPHQKDGKTDERETY